MMCLNKCLFVALTLSAVATLTNVKAMAATPPIMMAECRAHAGKFFKARLPDIDTKYEGQRTDGTHAVNGTAVFRGRTETFQCSFDRAGRRIIRFVVNKPAAESAPSGTNVPAVAAGDIRTEAVRFKSGQTSTSIRGTIIGQGSVSYVLGAESGQTMTIALKPSNLATYFNVYEPGKRPGDQALANSGITGLPMVPELNRFTAKLPTSGEYTISVYMMRSAARRNERSNYTLDISISALGEAAKLPPVQKDFADGLQGGPDYWDVKTNGPTSKVDLRAMPSSAAQVLGSVSDGTVLRNLGCRMTEGRRWCRVETLDTPPLSAWTEGDFLRESSYPPKQDALVKGTNFNATGNIPCARNAGQPMTACQFGVIRKGQGNGYVTVFWPDGGNRVIVFENGTPARFDQSQADGNVRMTVNRNADLFIITIGTQRFEIPEAVISGG